MVAGPLPGFDMPYDEFLRAFLACYFGFVAVHYTARLSALRARTGRPRAPIGRLGTSNARHQIVFRVFRTTILAVCVARVVAPEIDPYLLPITALQHWSIQTAGLIAMLAGLGLVDYAHSYLHDDWRSGIAGGAGVRLVTEGPYAYSRNPIFAGVLGGQLGFFLALPSVFTLACLAVGIAVILRQTGEEERVLATAFGASYADYRQTVARWFGRADKDAVPGAAGGPVLHS